MKRWGTSFVIAAGFAVIAGAAYWTLSGTERKSLLLPGQAVYTVTPMDLTIKISKDGELHAINNIDVVNRVEGQTAIQTLVKEGTTVKKGDVLATLDAAAIRQKIEDTTLELEKAEAEFANAKEVREIQVLQNNANLEAANVALEVARLDYKQYVEGTYPQQLRDAKITLEMAEITLKNKQDDLDQTRSLASKGFVTAADVKKGELEVTIARQALEKARSALLVLEDYQHATDMATKRNAVAQAEQRVARTQRENASNLSWRTNEMNSKGRSLQTLTRRMERYNEEFTACTITAPADGIVVYASSNDRNAEQPVREGSTMRERQVMMRLPDTASMKAVVRIQENQATRLKQGMRANVHVVGVPEPVGATLTSVSVLADNSQRWWNPDLKEYPVDLTLDQTPAGLKPGVGCSVQILLDEIQQTVAVPVGSIYSAGADSYVFTQQGEDVRPVKVTLGKAGDTHVQIESGLPVGTQVLVLQSGQGRRLMEETGATSAQIVTTVKTTSAPDPSHASAR